jgi:hypothetical protein
MMWHKRIGILVLTSTLLFEAGCFRNPAGEWSWDEVTRVTSPSGEIDAVLVEGNGGATTSFGYEVFLVKSGKKHDSGVHAAWLYGAVRNKHAYGVNLKWIEPQVLSVEYLRSKGERLVANPVQINGDDFEIRLNSGIEDPQAPSGGMLYNLQKSGGLK